LAKDVAVKKYRKQEILWSAVGTLWMLCWAASLILLQPSRDTYLGESIFTLDLFLGGLPGFYFFLLASSASPWGGDS
jgi:hypothetical protein